MTDERNDPLAGARASLFITTSVTGKRQVRGNLTRAERRAVADALDRELAALRARGVTFDDANVERPLDLIAVVRADDGSEIVLDPLSCLGPFFAPAIAADDPPGRRH
jgi:hypothetical protein